jgi:hypothetical protein
LQLYSFENITIQRVTFNTVSGINTIALNSVLGSWVLIANCTFHFKARAEDPEYDNSTIYIRASNYMIVQNQFVTQILPKRGGGRTAIEVHTPGPGIVSSNTVENFQVGIGVAGGHIQVFDNTLRGINFGIFMSSIAKDGGLQNVDIYRNSITVAQVQHNQISCGGIIMTPDREFDGLYLDVSVTDNKIEFEPEEPGRSGLAYNSTNGIGLNPPGSIVNITVTRNVVAGAPLRGITIGNTTGGSSSYTHIMIDQNSFTNCGQNLGMAKFFRAGIQLVGNLANISIVGNVIADEYPVPRCYYSVNCAPGTYKNVVMRNNRISTRSGRMLFVLQPGVTSDLT